MEAKLAQETRERRGCRGRRKNSESEQKKPHQNKEKIRLRFEKRTSARNKRGAVFSKGKMTLTREKKNRPILLRSAGGEEGGRREGKVWLIRRVHFAEWTP